MMVGAFVSCNGLLAGKYLGPYSARLDEHNEEQRAFPLTPCQSQCSLAGRLDVSMGVH